MTIQQLFNKQKSGEITEKKFLYEVRRQEGIRDYISQLMSFRDTVKALKNRGLITEIIEKSTDLTLDTANPYEFKKGIDYELELCYKPGGKIDSKEYIETQNKVLKNLGEDPNYYTRTLAGLEPTKKPDLATNANFGVKTKREDVNIPLEITEKGKGNFKDKNRQQILAKAKGEVTKSNVTGTLSDDFDKRVKSFIDHGVQPVVKTELPKNSSNQPAPKHKENKKNRTPKGIKVMTVIPKKLKGVKVMEIPGKEKIIKDKKIKLKEYFGYEDSKKKVLNEDLSNAVNQYGSTFLKWLSSNGYINSIGSKLSLNLDKVKNSLKHNSVEMARDVDGVIDMLYRKFTNNQKLKENIPATNTDVLPFANVKPGARASDDSGKTYKIIAVGNYDKLKRFDANKSFDKFLSSDPQGIDANQLVALIDANGLTSVRVYGTGGVYVYQNQSNAQPEPVTEFGNIGYHSGKDIGSNTDQDDDTIEDEDMMSEDFGNYSSSSTGGSKKPVVRVKANSSLDDPNQLKKYTDKGFDVERDLDEYSDTEEDPSQEPQQEYSELNILRHNDALKNFINSRGIRTQKGPTGHTSDLYYIGKDGNVISSVIYGYGKFGTVHDPNTGEIRKQVPDPSPSLNENFADEASAEKGEDPNEQKMAEVREILAKAYLGKNIHDIAVNKEGNVWAQVTVGNSGLDKRQLEILSKEDRFKGVYPGQTTSEIYLVFV